MAGNLVDMVRDRLSRSLNALRDGSRQLPRREISGSLDMKRYRGHQGREPFPLDMLKMRGAEAIKRYGFAGFPGLPRPRVHGNGFVQVDVVPDGSRRLHIWGHPGIPQQKTRSAIHNHVYGIKSRALVGRIIDISWIVSPYEPIDGQAYQVFEAVPRSGADTSLQGTGCTVSARVLRATVVGEGSATSEYVIPPGPFHSTVVDGPAATLMAKIPPPESGTTLARPAVLVPIGAEPDNTFDRNSHDPLYLWGIIDEVYPDWHTLIKR